ncbi:MAG: hypothetical protein KA369_23290 [Spirochaetes bacterium]|nr:hypothetical protein [Spirochaetota bacterium]
MRLLSRLFRTLSGEKKHQDRSKFETYDFSPERFECTMASISGTGACQDLFLNRYDDRELADIMERTGLMGHLRTTGFTKPLLLIDRDPNNIHYLKVYDAKAGPDRLLVDLRLSQILYTPGTKGARAVAPGGRFNVLAIEWISLQDPRRKFTADRPRLPGQDRPGLGAVRFLGPLVETIGRDLMADAALDVPEHFHAAVMYSRKFTYMDPAREGMMRGVLRDLGSHTLAELSWAFVDGAILDAVTGKPVPFEPSEQILPVTEGLIRHFASRDYRDRVEEEMKKKKYILDYGRMKQR